MRLSPLAQRTLASKAFSAGKQVLANTSGDLIYRGVIDQIVLAQDAVKLHYKPLTARSDLLLAQTEGYSADYVRASVDLMVLTGVAEKVWDWFRDYEDLAAFSDTPEAKLLMVRSIEEQLVLSSLAVNNVIVLRALVEVLALTQHVHQSVLVEYITHVLVIGQSCDLRTDFLRLLEENLTIAQVGSVKTTFLRNMAEVMALSHDTAVNADFVRALSNLLVLIDDAEGDRIIGGVLEAVSQTLTLSQGLLKTTAFNRADGRTLSLTTNAVGTRVTACEKIDFSLIGTACWATYQACLLNNQGSTGSDSFNAAWSGSFSGSNQYRHAVVSPAGYMYAIPLSATKVCKINPTNNASGLIGSTHTGSLKWVGGCLTLNGSNIFGCPYDSMSILTINVADDSTNTFGNITGSSKYNGIVCNKDGYVIITPFSATDVYYVECANTANLGVLVASVAAGNKYAGSVLGPNGTSVYCVPSAATQMGKVETANMGNATLVAVGSTWTGAGKAHGGILTENGIIYTIPFSNASIYKLDTSNDASSTFNGVSGTAKFVGGAYAMNKKMYCVSFNATYSLAVDTTNDSTSNVNTANSTIQWGGAGVFPDGRIVFIPQNQTAFGMLTPAATNAWTANVVESPYWNKY